MQTFAEGSAVAKWMKITDLHISILLFSKEIAYGYHKKSNAKACSYNQLTRT